MRLFSALTDEELLSLLQNGEEDAFTEIFNRYNKLLYSHVFNKLRDGQEAKDVVQDVFIKLWEKRSQIESGNLAGYLFTMARNRILNIVSHDRIVADYKAFLQRQPAAGIGHPDHLAQRKELETIIESEIAMLPPRMREVFMLSRKAWLSNKEIAVKLGLSEHTVADQIKKSLHRLRIKIATFLSF